MTLAEFLEARIADDEAVFRAAGMDWPEISGYLLPGFTEERALAECAAKRAIMELHDHDDRECFEMHRGIYGPGWPEGSYAVEGNAWAHPSLELQQGPCPTLRLLAAPYVSHVDFDPIWAGETTP